MISLIAVVNDAGSTGSPPPVLVAKRPRLMSLLLLSAWCGITAGLLEVGTIVIRKELFDPNHLYGMSRHFVWLIPVTNLGVFLVMGLLGWIAGLAWPRRGRWLFERILCALALVADAPDRLSPDLHVGLAGGELWESRHGSFRILSRIPVGSVGSSRSVFRWP